MAPGRGPRPAGGGRAPQPQAALSHSLELSRLSRCALIYPRATAGAARLQSLTVNILDLRLSRSNCFFLRGRASVHGRICAPVVYRTIRTPPQPLSVPRNASVDAPTSFNATRMARSPAPDLPPPACAQCGRNSHLHELLALPSWPFIRSARARGGVRGQGGPEGTIGATLRPRCAVRNTAHTMAGARRGPNSSFAMTSSFLRNQSSSRYMQRVPLDLSTTAGLQGSGAAQSARSLECRWLGRGQQTMSEGRGGGAAPQPRERSPRAPQISSAGSMVSPTMPSTRSCQNESCARRASAAQLSCPAGMGAAATAHGCHSTGRSPAGASGKSCGRTTRLRCGSLRPPTRA